MNISPALLAGGFGSTCTVNWLAVNPVGLVNEKFEKVLVVTASVIVQLNPGVTQSEYETCETLHGAASAVL
ncbi:MAG TPA: hypothetical protein VNN75_10655, partial [Stellaceae bacterium]|nr:hypothetical protein [Stellaceae bacterium]